MKQCLTIIILALCFASAFAQQSALEVLERRGEVYFRFEADAETVANVSRSISVDNYQNGFCYAYANYAEFQKFLGLGLPYELVGDYYHKRNELLMANSVDEMYDWNRYPTYAVYAEMMRKFAEDYPEICRLDTIGTSFSGYHLLVLKISDNVDADEMEPEVFLGGQIHGDELIGGVLCLKLIDELLSGYGSDEQITSMVDNLEIFVNPLSNPEGTYFYGGNDVSQSIRYTRIGNSMSDFIDINRNFPDALDGEHPDGSAYSIETQAFMDFADSHHFVLSANIHSGAEVVNYPYDTESSLPADDQWWRDVSAEYANIVRDASNDRYFDGAGFDCGYTNGYAWYSISGSRQDYMNYFQNCREVTLELSNTKKIPSAELQNYIMWNVPALMQYFSNANNGLRGVVTDSLTGIPLEAKVFIQGHDYFNSHVFSNAETGEYYRFLSSGIYDVSFYAEGYLLKTETVNITDGESLSLDVELVPATYTLLPEVSAIEMAEVYPNPVSDFLYTNFAMPLEVVEIFDITGKKVAKSENVFGGIDVSGLASGQYFAKLTREGESKVLKFEKVED
ncbi:MAG: T9SS type A sorting domain-containing protein [Bacteroidales bacterium]|nr:T9SS type A sorting domain-containing protein [Bacteroidales bacterium]